MKTTKAHISTIRVGDTLLINNQEITLGKKDIKQCAFMGTSILGDSSTRMLTVVLFPKYRKGELVGYARQPQ